MRTTESVDRTEASELLCLIIEELANVRSRPLAFDATAGEGRGEGSCSSRLDGLGLAILSTLFFCLA